MRVRCIKLPLAHSIVFLFLVNMLDNYPISVQGKCCAVLCLCVFIYVYCIVGIFSRICNFLFNEKGAQFCANSCRNIIVYVGIVTNALNNFPDSVFVTENNQV